MELRCEGCAGCCVDWRPVDPDAAGEGDRGGRRPAVDDAYDLVPLTRDEVARFLDRGLGDVLVPRLFEAATDDDRVTVDGTELAAIRGRPAFVVGLRKPPKPVAPIGTDRLRWLDTCVFLDPTTLQCRIHGDAEYPRSCSVYPAHNLTLGSETECERVESAGGGDRLLDRSVPEETPPPPFGPQALGATVFAYPDPDDLNGVVERLRTGSPIDEDVARFVGAAVGSRPGSIDVDRERMADAEARARKADSWAGDAIDTWEALSSGPGAPVVIDEEHAELVRRVEDDTGAPETPGW